MGALWTDEARMEAWRRVEVAAGEEMAGPTPEDLEAIRAATFTVEAVQERERITDHDVAAFVDVLAASAGPAGRWIHFGLTSSDVLDTALALQLQRVGEVLVPAARAYADTLADRAPAPALHPHRGGGALAPAPRAHPDPPAARPREHADPVCAGPPHGVHADPTTFGVKLAGFAMEASRNAHRLERAFAQAATG